MRRTNETTLDREPHTLMVTPLMARGFLQNVDQPRVGLKQGYFVHHMERLQRTMLAGGWMLLRADPLMFNMARALCNGRHRMEALARCPDSIGALPFSVLYNVTEEELRLVDRQKPRTIADALQADTKVVAIATIIWEVCNGGGGTVSEDELEPYVLRVEPVYATMVALSGSMVGKRIWSSSMVLAGIAAIGLESGPESREFLHALEQHSLIKTGDVELQRRACNAVLSLRNQLEDGGGGRRNKFSRHERLARVVQAFSLAHATSTRVQIKNRDIYLDRVRAQFSDITKANRAKVREGKGTAPKAVAPAPTFRTRKGVEARVGHGAT